MKLYVDDVRDAPDDTWEVARDYDEALAYLITGKVELVSLDHDLGFQEVRTENGWIVYADSDGMTGYDIACWIEEQVFCDENFNCPEIRCHSANPVGRERIERVIASIQRRVK